MSWDQAPQALRAQPRSSSTWKSGPREASPGKSETQQGPLGGLPCVPSPRLPACHFTKPSQPPCMRGPHCAHFPDGETESWSIKSSHKLMQGIVAEPFPGGKQGTRALSWSQASHPVSRRSSWEPHRVEKEETSAVGQRMSWLRAMISPNNCSKFKSTSGPALHKTLLFSKPW